MLLANCHALENLHGFLGCFAQVLEYLKKHHEFDKTSASTEDRDAWDKKYVEVEDEVLFHLILAANFLDIKDLLDLTCKTVAEYIKQCKTPEEIRQRFNIPNDFTPEEEEEVRATWVA